MTLGSMAMYRGVAFVMTKAQAFKAFPPQFTDGLIRYKIMWGDTNLYPVPLIIMLGVTVFAVWFLKHAINGRYIFAVGGNEQAALFSGLPVKAIKLKVYAFSGMTAGIAAMIMLGYYGSASAHAGKGCELDVLGAGGGGGGTLARRAGTAAGALLWA